MSTTPDAVVADLARADLLLWLSHGFRTPAADRPAPLDDADRAALIEAAGLGADSPAADALKELVQSQARTSLADRTQVYHHLFEAPGLCPVTEASYVRRDKGAILADICGFYNAFGFKPASDQGDRPDHLACELEFLAMLLVMLAQARQQRQDESAQITRRAIESFAADHLDVWLAPLCDRLAEAQVLPLFGHLSQALRTTWEALVAALNLPRAAEAGDVPLPPNDADSPYECGMADAAGPVALNLHGQPIPQ